MHELVYGTTRLRGRLDHLLARHLHKGLESLEASVLEVLRLGAYQALYMGSVPAYAAVSESVDLATATSGRPAAGLVNAVLRKVARDGDGAQLFPDQDADPQGFLTTWGSHPDWLVTRWLGRWSAAQVRRLVELDNERPDVFLRVLEGSREEALDRLSAAGIAGRAVPGVARAIRLGQGADVAEALRALPRSLVQDPAAQLVVDYADIPAGTKVADLCAAPGGKALALSTMALYTLAVDRSEPRMRMLRDNAHRTGCRLGLVVADATRPPLERAGAVLLDVPCTGTGTLARHPDARWRLREDDVRELADVQTRLLAAAADVVEPNGLLIYSTCTLEPEENEAQIESFLEADTRFRVESTGAVAGFVDDQGRLSVLPQATEFDGSFAVRLRRAS